MDKMNASSPLDAGAPPTTPLLTEKQRGELWLYLGVAICAAELLICVAALCYGFIATPAAHRSGGGLVFPWLSWGATMVLAPALILLAVHLADVGLFRISAKEAQDRDWQDHLPERLQRLYRIIKGAPIVVVLLSLVVLGATLITLDGAIDFVRSFGAALLPYIPHIVIGVATVVCAVTLAAVWLRYRTRKLYAEYEFRREVLTKTGVIIVDKGATALPPADIQALPPAYTIEIQSLPPGQEQRERG